MAVVFNLAVNLHLKKILVRLGLRRPPHERVSPPRGHLVLRLRSLLNTLKPIRKPPSKTPSVFATHLDELQSFVDKVKTSPAGGNSEAVKAVVKKAFDITSSVQGRSFDTVLAEMGMPKRDLDSRTIRDLKKLANYWRICEFLTKTSRSYRPLFSVIKLRVLEHFFPLSAVSSSSKLYVHAEIQIISHYESSPTGLRPRAIGASKEACFLCDALINGHGLFRVSKAHRQLYTSWTVPDRKEYNVKAVERLRAALYHTKRRVEAEIKAKHQSGQQRQFPLQSSVNLNNPLIPPGSVTSATTHNSLRKAVASTATAPSSGSSSSTLTVKPNSPFTKQLKIPEQMTITAETPLELALDDLTLHASFDGPDGPDGPHSSHGNIVRAGNHHGYDHAIFSKGSIIIDRDSDTSTGEHVDLLGLPRGEDRVLSVPASAQGHNLTFTLGSGEQTLVNVTCIWHR